MLTYAVCNVQLKLWDIQKKNATHDHERKEADQEMDRPLDYETGDSKTTTKILEYLIGKLDNIHEHMGNVSRETEMIKMVKWKC